MEGESAEERREGAEVYIRLVRGRKRTERRKLAALLDWRDCIWFLKRKKTASLDFWRFLAAINVLRYYTRGSSRASVGGCGRYRAGR